jgi:glycosyltransferase involved in cell wall biosynthesis
MKVAYFTPLNPVKTGISDYSEEMLPYLARHLECDIYIDKNSCPGNLELLKDFNVIPFEEGSFKPDHYDEILYHMGNDYSAHAFIYRALLKYPGIVVLHDYVLQGFYAEKYDADGDFSSYQSRLIKYYGEDGEKIADRTALREPYPIWESEQALNFPLNEEIAAHSKGLIVHSDFVKTRVQKKTSRPVRKIHHHGHILKSFDRDSIRSELGLGPKDILIAAAGYINRNKRYTQILNALARIRNLSFTFAVAGTDRGGILDNCAPPDCPPVIKLGHLDLPRLEKFIYASDICINLRYPTMGESSGMLIRMMGYGRPVLVTDYGSYAEFPDYAVIKIAPGIDEEELIKRFVEALIQDEDFRKSAGREASGYVKKKCSIDKCAREYAAFIQFIHAQGGAV